MLSVKQKYTEITEVQTKIVFGGQYIKCVCDLLSYTEMSSDFTF